VDSSKGKTWVSYPSRPALREEIKAIEKKKNSGKGKLEAKLTQRH